MPNAKKEMKNTETSYPRDKIKIVLLESISESAADTFRNRGYSNVRSIPGALNEAELIAALKGTHILGIRSKTRLTKNVIDASDKTLAIGCFCIGVNQVELRAATTRGVAVFNAPYSNTRSVAELVIGLCVMLIRKVIEKNTAAHRGLWLKEATGSYELRGKTLGIVGYGNIGSQVSVMAEAMGMNVIYYDISPKLPHGNARQVGSLPELLKRSDIVTLHVPGNAATRNMIDNTALRHVKKGALLINYSRGDVLDLEALKNAIQRGAISGAAVDVFPHEPENRGDSFVSVLQEMPNVILTPHIGGSTEEAQASIGIEVATKLIQYLEFGTSIGSHTVPEVNLPPQDKSHRILHIHENIPGVLGEINSKLSNRGINILGQYLKTNEEIGYVVLDVDRRLSAEALKILREIRGTMKTRVVY